MVQNARKHTVPAGNETSVSRATFFETALESISDVVPVANTTERAQLVAELIDANVGPTAARPLVVLRGDARGLHKIEYTENGTVWLSGSGVLEFPTLTARNTWTLSNSGLLTPSDLCVVAGVQYVWSGTAWSKSVTRAQTARVRKGGVQTGITQNFTNVLTANMPGAAPGRYRADVTAVTYTNAVATHFKSVRVGGESASVGTGTPMDGAGDWIQNWPANVHCKQTDTWFFDYAGGDLAVHLDVAIDAGATRAATDGCRIAIQYLGLP